MDKTIERNFDWLYSFVSPTLTALQGRPVKLYSPTLIRGFVDKALFKTLTFVMSSTQKTQNKYIYKGLKHTSNINQPSKIVLPGI